jgi:hypothetical protein
MRGSLAGYLLLTVCAFAISTQAQSATCLDLADEPHHRLLFQNQDARVFLLELPRLASTQSHCHSHPYLYVIAAASRTLDTVDGHAGISRDWNESEARFIYPPMKHVVRNESINPFRELIVETLHGAQYNPLDGNYDGDLFPGDLGGAKPTWTVSFSRGPLTASRTQLAPGAELSVSSPNHVLLAVTDLELQEQESGKATETLELRAQDVRMLPGGSTFKLVNASQHSAKFVLVEF